MTGTKTTQVLITVLLCLGLKIIMEQRTNTTFCFKLGKKFAETYELLKKKVYGDDYMGRTQVFTWFKNARDNLNDD